VAEGKDGDAPANAVPVEVPVAVDVVVEVGVEVGVGVEVAAAVPVDVGSDPAAVVVAGRGLGAVSSVSRVMVGLSAAAGCAPAATRCR
jgi:hypothetical protein